MREPSPQRPSRPLPAPGAHEVAWPPRWYGPGGILRALLAPVVGAGLLVAGLLGLDLLLSIVDTQRPAPPTPAAMIGAPLDPGGHAVAQLVEGGLRAAGGPVVVSALDRSSIDAVIERHMDRLRYCYQRELVAGSPLMTRLQVDFTISPDGAVRSVRVESGPGRSLVVEECVGQLFLKMRFPATDGPTEVRYPFLFHPG